MCIFIFLCFYNNYSIESIKIILLSGNSDKSHSYFVGERCKFYIRITPNNTNEIISLQRSNKNLIELFNDSILMKSTGRECLTASTKKISSTICFNIYNIPELSFKEDQSIKIETNSVIKFNLDKNYYNKSNIKYISDHPQIIKVDIEGMITAIRPGKAIITISCLGYKNIQINVTAIVKNGLINNNILDIYNIREYENIMIVAHPDDETLWGGANLIKDKYFVVCLTNGYDSIRANEFKELLKFTKSGGIILNYPDVQDSIRDDWSEVKTGILKDLTTIINYKHWNKIVTYGYDGTYGHIQHKKTCEYVTEITKKLNKYNSLYYFEKFYQKNEIPNNLKRISDKELAYKLKEIDIYKSQKYGIYQSLFHILPYENLISASQT